ncbi:glycosyltransferase family 4 protein [Colwellia chukchiensis]|nr:glycosyltransferase family 4 protein [Colwellia chukchiensis]
MQSSSKTDLYYIHLYNDFSGSPRVLRDAIDSEVHQSQQTYVFTSKHKGFLDGAAAQRVNCFYARSNNKYLQLFYFLIAQFFIFVKLFSYLVSGAIQGRKAIVIINTMLPFGAAIAAKLLARQVIYYVHETYITPESLKLFLRFFIEHCASHVIFVSKYLALQERFIKPHQEVIYNGLRSDFPVIQDVDYRFKFSNKQLFFAGSLKSYKGVDKLVKIANALPTFKVVAAVNCTQQELDGFISQYKPPSNMHILIRPKNIHEHFAASFLVLNLSDVEHCVETFGLSLIEGMATGSPVVAPPVGGPTEFVNKYNGLLINAERVAKIIEFINYLNSSEAIWQRFAKQAYLDAQSFTSVQFKITFKDYAIRHEFIAELHH